MNTLYKIDGNKLIINEGVTDLYYKDFNEDASRMKTGLRGIEEIYLPDSVKFIHKFTFHNFRNLKNIKLSASLLSIDDNAFNGCESLTEINFPESLQSIGSDAFNMCHNLTEINLPNSLKTIRGGTFGNCFRLEQIKIPDSVVSIEHNAFYCCVNLTHIEFPDSIKQLSSFLFRGCTRLAEVRLPENLKEIREGVFEDCSSLKTLNIPNSVHSIGKGAFIRCSDLEEVRLPDKLGMLQEAVFQQCISLKNVYVNKSLDFIDDYAFCGCEGVTVKIPAEADVHITKDAFKHTSNMMLEIGDRKECWGKLSPSYFKNPYPIQFLITPTYDNFIKIKDTEIKIKFALKYHSQDERFKSYLKRYPDKVLDYAAKNENIEAVDFIIDNNLISKNQIDKCIEFVRKGNFEEMFVMLAKYKEEIGGYSKTSVHDRFDL